MNVRKEKNSSGQLITYATVYVSHEKRKYFVKKLEEYLNKNTDEGNPRNQVLVASIADIRSALLVDSFWTDIRVPKPGDEKKGVEVWLRGGSEEDCQAVDPAWGAHDHDRHGTLMAGAALYGA
ncbi:MAG: hypothetical protein P8Y45_04110 [Exilibacterium sp.]